VRAKSASRRHKGRRQAEQQINTNTCIDVTPHSHISPKVRGIAGHIEQAERGAIRKSPQAHKHFCPLLPTAMVFISYGFVLVQVQVQPYKRSSLCAPCPRQQRLSADGRKKHNNADTWCDRSLSSSGLFWLSPLTPHSLAVITRCRLSCPSSPPSLLPLPPPRPPRPPRPGLSPIPRAVLDLPLKKQKHIVSPN
jgi:hypothetical protein